MVDKPKLDQMLGNLKRYVASLRTLGGVSREEFLASPDKIGSAKYHFVIAIECCIDVANHIIASQRFRMPRDNADSFVVLAEEGVLPAESKSAFRAMARFRNRLVHLYWEIDDDRIWTYLGQSLADFERFASAVGRLAD